MASKLRSLLGWLTLIIGVSVFAIRLQHEGPYAVPRHGNLLAGVLALAFGLWLVRPWRGAGRLATRLTGVVIAATPIVLFFALYATLAELEEVVVLYATDQQGNAQALRLWVVDDGGAPWVTMPRSKADVHGLTDARVELMRKGSVSCVLARRHEDPASVEKIHRLRHEKYSIQRLGTLIGLFGRSPGEGVVALRLDPCASP